MVRATRVVFDDGPAFGSTALLVDESLSSVLGPTREIHNGPRLTGGSDISGLLEDTIAVVVVSAALFVEAVIEGTGSTPEPGKGGVVSWGLLAVVRGDTASTGVNTRGG